MPINVRVPIEVDITYTNKTWFSLKAKVNPRIKHYVIGFYQRGIKNVRGVAIIKAMPNNKPDTIERFMFETIEQGATLYCQENILPTSLKDYYDIHELKDSDGHAKGQLHINNVNNMWKDLRRLIKQEHISVSQKHLQLYCGEVAWRINTNHMTGEERFNDLLSKVNDTRLTLNDLTSRKPF
jgi:hypothetical protein